MLKKILLLSVFLLSPIIHAEPEHNHDHNLSAVNSFIALDLTAPFEFEHSEHNKAGIRSAELIFFGPVDKTFNAMFNLSVHEDHGEYITEIHEAYLTSDKISPHLNIRVGKFFLNLGRLNQIHQHDWDFTNAPKVHAEFFADEGVNDTGAEITVILPTVSDHDFTFGITNGYSFGHSHDEGQKPQVPTHYLHYINHHEVSDTQAWQWGLNYLGRKDHEATQTHLYGLDFVLKDGGTGHQVKTLIQGEVWLRDQAALQVADQRAWGAYLYPQTALTEKSFLGLRFDYFESVPTAHNEFSIVPTYTYRNSDNILWRVSYAYSSLHIGEENRNLEQRLDFQFVVLLGEHPAHNF